MIAAASSVVFVAIATSRVGGDDPLRLHRGFRLDRGS
jgi:hypothetical protein